MDYVLIKKKWMESFTNWDTYCYFEVILRITESSQKRFACVYVEKKGNS